MSIDIEIEPALLRNASTYVTGELAAEYKKSVRRAGEQLILSNLVSVALSGEDVDASVRDDRQAYKVRMTLPLFGSMSTTQCECLKHIAASGDPRCAHVWAVFKVLSAKFAELIDRELRSTSYEALFDAFDDFVDQHARGRNHSESAAISESPWSLDNKSESSVAQEEIRTIWKLKLPLNSDAAEALTLDLAPFLQTRLQTQLGTEAWSRGRRLQWAEFIHSPTLWTSQVDHLAAARIKPVRMGQDSDFDVDVFGLIEDLNDHALVFAEDSGEPISIAEGKIGLAVQSRTEGIVVASQIDGAAAIRQWIFDGRGYVTLASQPWRLYFAHCNRATTDFLTRLERTAKPIPTLERERLLSYLVRLEQHLAVAVADNIVEPSPIAASEHLYLRLTPMQPSGLKIEMLVRPAPSGSYFPVGIGPETVLDVSDKDRPRNVIRNFDREAETGRRVAEATGLLRLPCVNGHIWFLRGDDAALDLVTTLANYADKDPLIVEWPQYAHRTYELAEPLTQQTFHIAVGEGRDWFDIKGEVEVSGQALSLSELMQAVKRKLRYIQLKDGRWTRVTDLFQKRLSKLASLVEQDRDRLTLPIASLPELQAWDPEQEQVCIKAASESWQRAFRQFQQAQTLACPVPAGFRASLRSYQREGFEWMSRLAAWGMGACLADDMGLGKTIQTLAVLMRLAGEGPSLVIAPTSVGPNWLKEALRFASGLKPMIYRDTDRHALLTRLNPGDLVICSYGLAQRDAEQLAAVDWNVLVLDEAQAIKNFQTKTAQGISNLRAHWRLALTGTPIENSLSELWSIFRIVAPGMLGSWESFKRSYAVPIERYDLQGARQALSARIRPFILRRLKEDHLNELPPKTEIDLMVTLSEEERRLYDAVRLASLSSLTERARRAEEKGEALDQRFAILAALTKLRQIACHPRLFDTDWSGSSAKLSVFLEVCRDLKANKHRALVFSQFTSYLQLLAAALDTIGASYHYLDGSTEQSRRAGLVDSFQAGHVDFFLISVKAGGTGLTLTAADYVLHMDPWWNPAVEDQATDRAHRIGQTKPLTVYRFITAGTIEEKILELHATKRDLIEKLIAGGAGEATVKSEELIQLLTDTKSGANLTKDRRPRPPHPAEIAVIPEQGRATQKT